MTGYVLFLTPPHDYLTTEGDDKDVCAWLPASADNKPVI